MGLWKHNIEATPRLLLFFCSVPVMLIASSLSGIGFVLKSALFLVTGTVLWMVWFVFLFLIALPTTDDSLRNRVRALKRVALVSLAVLFTAGIVEAVLVPMLSSGLLSTERWSRESSDVSDGLTKSYAYNDATALTHQALNRLFEGDNPYAHANVVQAMVTFAGSYDRVTPLRTGRFAEAWPYPEPAELLELWQQALKSPQQVPTELESRLNYPAGSFLLPAPLVAMGIADLRIVNAVYIVLALACVIWLIPKKWRLVFIAAVLISLEIPNSVAAGETGTLLFPLLLLAWVLAPRRLWISALFMGAAVATKQVAWFHLPFYLILVLTTKGGWRAILATTIIVIVFLATNIPFVISDPGLWLLSVWAPMIDPMFPLGVGMVSVVTSGILNIRSSLLFAVLEVGVMLAAMLWYIRNCARYPSAGPILAILPLFFAWRSLWPYFFYTDIIVVAGILINEYGGPRLRPSQVDR